MVLVLPPPAVDFFAMTLFACKSSRAFCEAAIKFFRATAAAEIGASDPSIDAADRFVAEREVDSFPLVALLPDEVELLLLVFLADVGVSKLEVLLEAAEGVVSFEAEPCTDEPDLRDVGVSDRRGVDSEDVDMWRLERFDADAGRCAERLRCGPEDNDEDEEVAEG